MSALFFATSLGKASRPLPAIHSLEWAFGSSGSRMVLGVVIVYELALASMLAVRVSPSTTLWTTAGTMMVFLLWNVTAWLGFGRTECGCGLSNPLAGLLSPVQSSILINLVGTILCAIGARVASQARHTIVIKEGVRT